MHILIACLIQMNADQRLSCWSLDLNSLRGRHPLLAYSAQSVGSLTLHLRMESRAALFWLAAVLGVCLGTCCVALQVSVVFQRESWWEGMSVNREMSGWL